MAPGVRALRARLLVDAALAAMAVAAVLVAVVLLVGPVEDGVRAAPWLMGPALWVMTTLGAGALLRRSPRPAPHALALAAAIVIGAAADALVVAAGHPWPGLFVGVLVFASATAALGAGRRPLGR